MRAYTMNGTSGGKFDAGTILGAAGAAGAGLPPGFGAMVGQFIVNTLGHMFGFGQPKDWQNAGEGVHQWFTDYGPQAFLDWMRANYAQAFDTLDHVLALYPVWHWTEHQQMIRRDTVIPQQWKDSVTLPAYEAMGIDYAKSFANYLANRKSPTEPMSAAYAIATPVVQAGGLPAGAQQGALDLLTKEETGGALSPDEQAAADAAGGSSNMLLIAAALGGALLLSKR